MAWWHRAKPGDKVVCVSLPVWSDTFNEKFRLGVQIGKVYTILEVAPDTWFSSGVGLYVGTICPDTGFKERISATCFRPVQKKSTESSMAALRAHLNMGEVEVDT